VGEGTSAGRAEVLAAREAVLLARGTLDDEIVRLEASARAAIDIPAKIRRNPVRTAGLVAGTGFLAVRGPKRLWRTAKRVVRGPEEPLPPSMLPKEIDAALRRMGTDGERVRGLLEHEFASYLSATEPARKRRDLSGAFTVASVALLRPIAIRAGKRLADELLSSDDTAFQAQMAKVRDRRAKSGIDKAD